MQHWVQVLKVILFCWLIMEAFSFHTCFLKKSNEQHISLKTLERIHAIITSFI